MSLTVTLANDWMMNPGDRNAVRATIAFDASYPTGGESLTAEMLGLSTLDFVAIGNKSGYVFEYDYTNEKVLVYGSAAATPAGTISKPTFTVTKGAILASSELGLSADVATGTVNNDAIASTLTLTTNSPVSAPTFTGTAIAAAALAQVANATDLATLTGVAVYAIGRP